MINLISFSASSSAIAIAILMQIVLANRFKNEFKIEISKISTFSIFYKSETVASTEEKITFF